MLERQRPRWYVDSACYEEDSSMFFPGKGESKKIHQAISICMTCPVREKCHAYAMENEIEHGVWGGSTPKQRSKWIKRKLSVEETWEKLK